MLFKRCIVERKEEKKRWDSLTFPFFLVVCVSLDYPPFCRASADERQKISGYVQNWFCASPIKVYDDYAMFIVCSAQPFAIYLIQT